MKKGIRLFRRIFIILLVMICICIAAAFVFRNALITSILPPFIAEQSESKITLKIKDVMTSLSGDILLLEPMLNFDSTFLDKSRSIQLEALSFDTIHIYGPSFQSAIMHDIIKADSLVITAPRLKIRELGEPVWDGDQQDGRMLEVLYGSDSAEQAINIQIGKILVNNGMLDLKAIGMAKDTSKMIDFNIYIEKFSTLPEDNAGKERILFADDIAFEVFNIDDITVANYDIDLGSLIFSIKKNQLRVRSIDIFPHVLSDSIDQIAIAAKNIDLNGLSINEIRGREDIQLRSVRISDGYFITNTNKVKKSSLDAHNNFFSGFSDNFLRFTLDTLGVHNFNLEFIEHLSDSTLWITNMNMELFGVVIDSTMMDDIYRELEFVDFTVRAGPLGYNQPENELSVKSDSLFHIGAQQKSTVVFNTHIHSKDELDVTIGMIKLNGLSEDPIPYPDKMDISIFINDIDGTIRPGKSINEDKPVRSGNVDVFDYIKLDTISVRNTKLNIDDNSISVAYAALTGGQLTIREASYSTDDRLGRNSTSLGSLSLNKVSLEHILQSNELSAGALQLDKLTTTGEFIIPPPSYQEKGKPALPMDRIALGGVALNNCSFDTWVTANGDTYYINSSMDISLDSFRFDGSTADIFDLDEIEGKISMRNTKVLAFDHQVVIGDLQLNLHPESIRLSKLLIEHDPGAGHPGIIINHLSLPELEISGLDLFKIAKQERFDYRQLDYSKIIVEGIDAKLELNPDSNSRYISIEDLSLAHDYPEKQDMNFMDDISFSFGNVMIENPAASSLIRVGSGNYTAAGNILTMEQILSGNLINMPGGTSAKPGWQFSSEEIQVRGLNIKNSYPSRLGINKLILSNADIVISSEEKARSGTSLKLDIESYRNIGNIMTNLNIDTTLLKEVRINYKTFTDTSSHTFLVDSIGLVVHNMDIDTSIFENTDQEIVNQMSIDLKGRTRITEDSLYLIRSGLVNYDFRNDFISIDSFEVIPRYEGREFFIKAKHQTDRIKLFGRRIEAYNFRLDEMLDDDLVHFGRIDISGLHLEMMRDKTIPRKPNDYKPMPQDMLRNAGQKFTVDSVRVINSFLSYGEYVEKSDLPGVVNFDDFNLRMYNLSSDLPRPDPATALKVDLNALLMGDFRFDLSLVFPLRGNANNFWMEASSEEIDLGSISPMTENLLGLSINDGRGRIRESFISGDSINTRGTILFTYSNLKLNLYNRKKAEQNKGMFAGITNFLINDLLIHKKNPKFGKAPRIGQVYFERDTEKAILNYVWKSLLSGLLSSIGINTKEQRQERRDMKGKGSMSD